MAQVNNINPIKPDGKIATHVDHNFYIPAICVDYPDYPQ